MENQETKCSGQAVALAFLGGAVAGVVAGLLFAPKSGEEARRALKGMPEGLRKKPWRRRRRREPPLIRLLKAASIWSLRKRRMSKRRSRPDERP